MRAIDSGVISGPTSLSTSRRSGDPSMPASAMPISPPIETPTQSTVSTSRRAIRVTMSAT